ncbi:MAG TPA: hypothetical protein VFU30_09540 [Gaiellaceae bacterium]|nr:hypothetical protein [Gaiellaceae bacterium]
MSGSCLSSANWATRELARRVTGTVEVLLLWHPEGDWVELALCDLAVGVGCQVEVAPDSALDAFYHPYAYTTCFRDEAIVDA